MKKRIDRLLVERGLAGSREKAQAMVMAGNVLLNGQPARKAGVTASEDADIQLKETQTPYVGRGGLKLEGAARMFGLHIGGKTCLDVGASTGGFTHFLLLHGAERVFAVDVDVKQLHWRIRNDPRVRLIQMNARFLKSSDIGELVDLVTIDASFISLTMLIPRIPPVLKTGGNCLALVKPQFEVGRGSVGRGGIVTDPHLQHESVEKTRRCGSQCGLHFVGSCESPITGREGNREFFVLFRK